MEWGSLSPSGYIYDGVHSLSNLWYFMSFDAFEVVYGSLWIAIGVVRTNSNLLLPRFASDDHNSPIPGVFVV